MARRTLRWSCPGCPIVVAVSNPNQFAEDEIRRLMRMHAEEAQHEVGELLEVEEAPMQSDSQLSVAIAELVTQQLVQAIRQTTEVLAGGMDHLELGTPGTGLVKVRGDFSDPRSFKQKIDAANEMLAYARKTRPA